MNARQASIPNSDNITRRELDNGVNVLVYENPAVQSVNIIGSIHAGSIYESPAHNGLASLVAGALMTGTATRDFDGLHGELEDIGADLGFRGHLHKLGFSGKSLAEDLPTLIDVASDALRNPTFPDEHVERLRGERLTWLQYSNFDTRYRASKAMREALYPAVSPLSLQRLRQRSQHREHGRERLEALSPPALRPARYDSGDRRRRIGC